MTPERIASLLTNQVPGQTKRIALAYIPPAATGKADEIKLTEWDFAPDRPTAEALGPTIYEAAQYDCEERRQKSRYSVTGFDTKNKETCYHVIFQRPEQPPEEDQVIVDDPSPTGLLAQHMKLTQTAYTQITANTKELMGATRSIMTAQDATIKILTKRLSALEKERELLLEIISHYKSSDVNNDERKSRDQRWDRVIQIAEDHLLPAVKRKLLANPEAVKMLENLSPEMLEAVRNLSAAEAAAGESTASEADAAAGDPILSTASEAE